MNENEPGGCATQFEDDEEDYELERESPICDYCSGTGGDPSNDGALPCDYCDGYGYKWWL